MYLFRVTHSLQNKTECSAAVLNRPRADQSMLGFSYVAWFREIRSSAAQKVVVLEQKTLRSFLATAACFGILCESGTNY